ncbi:transcriptional repressor p66-alpha-like [Triplophysa dalaica]|uniref:transcriptional repressor p66-alpha-like n=1 Tax=Triplophysa dalaica TaxID=1582913 RepID=UPI0024DF8F9D|nr:transcriptional repressor p66-alpha-like [Triplophysa dalaica]
MSEDASRLTRSQKRALERECVSVDSKRVRLEAEEQDDRSRCETSSPLSAGEVKATLKLKVQTGDEPVDMSTIKTDTREVRSPQSPDDVIVLSDNETSSPHVNGRNHFQELNTQLLMKSSPQERERVITQFMEELRLEETKLILLKKLKHAQIQKDSNTQKVISDRSSATLPPLVRGAQMSKAGSQMMMPPLVRGAQATTQQMSSSTPALLLAPHVHSHKIIQPGLIRVTNAPNGGLLLSISQSSAANLKPANVSDSPASRQAAAKLALRKQLQKTLLEIPSPKPAAAQFNFLPSAANNEFIYLLGLEEVVHNILHSLGRGKQGVYAGLVVSAQEPYCCSQCQTDFTRQWRKDKGGATMCEQCMSSNQKKVVKAEHTNRLKAAFVKALQQEQEILQQTTLSSSSSSSSAHRMTVDPVKQHSHARSSQPITRHPATIKQSPVQISRGVAAVRRIPHSFSPSSQLQNAVAAAALVSRPGVTMAYVNPSLSVLKSSSSSAERQREYLLDMIPSPSASVWK